LAPEPIQPEPFSKSFPKATASLWLSNTDPIHMADAESAFPILPVLSIRIYSFRVAPTNPIRLIYAEALRACKARAEEAIFIG